MAAGHPHPPPRHPATPPPRHRRRPPALHLPDAVVAERLAIVTAVKDALVQATHVLPHTWTSYAVDETGVWSWPKGKRKPANLPDVDPTDEDDDLAAKVASGAVTLDEDLVLDHPLDEDDPRTQDEAVSAGEDPDAGTPTGNGGTDTQDTIKRKAPITCWLASWGVKTHTTGKRSSYHGYAMHVLLHVPDAIKGGGKGARTQSLAEPLLIEEMGLTAASTDVVAVTLGMIKNALSRGHKVVDLIGDRHYSYKKYVRWVSKLWALGVRQALDLRQDDHGVVDYDGSQIIAGTPHCGVPDHLVVIERPGKNASKQDIEIFTRQVEERQAHTMTRAQTAWQNGDGKTRWRCGAKNGTTGCPRVEGSVEIALANNLPIVTPPETQLP